MNDVDGKVIIGTTLETKSVDAQIKELEKKLEIMTQTLETDMKIPVELRMSEAPLKVCPECGGENCLNRKFEPVSFVNHCGGFFSNNNIGSNLNK